MKTILITGGSGLIGTALTKELLDLGYSVRHLSRSKRKVDGVEVYPWDVNTSTVASGVLSGVDTIVHLAGAGIIDEPWTEKRLRALERSRASAALLLKKQPGAEKVKSFISASGINYYGTVTTDHIFSEDDPPGTDTVARLTVAWENAVDQWNGTARVVKLRTPMVLAKKGGALPKLSRPVRWGVGSPLGSGKQWMPWIHIDDLVHCYVHAIEHNAMQGAYNVVALDQLRNAEFMCTVAQVLDKPFFLPHVPAFVLKVMLGERAGLVLKGSRASNDRSLASGQEFRFPRLKDALADLLP